MEQFAHIKSVIAIILGLSLANLIQGTVFFIQHPGRKKIYTVHLLWVIYVFLLTIHFWWWEFNLKLITTWYFLDYFFIIIYILLYYIMSAILYPADLKDYSGYKDYFYSRKNWFFGVLGIVFLADLVDTFIKGETYLVNVQTEYYYRCGIHVLLCIAAMFTKNVKFHTALVILFLIYELSFILRFFNLE